MFPSLISFFFRFVYIYVFLVFSFISLVSMFVSYFLIFFFFLFFVYLSDIRGEEDGPGSRHRLGALTVCSLGRIECKLEHFHTPDVLYPHGYVAKRTYWSCSILLYPISFVLLIFYLIFFLRLMTDDANELNNSIKFIRTKTLHEYTFILSVRPNYDFYYDFYYL